MKRVMFALALLALAVVPAQAAICDLGNNPSATLLLPYFEVDTARTDGANTVFSVSNAFAYAQLAHITIWSDLSVPVLDFNVYLTGYDQVTVDLGAIILNGILPGTASAGQDPADTISHKGIISQDINFASCAGQLPSPTLPAIFLTHLQNSLTGRPSVILGNRCAGRKIDKIARGYITIDVVNNCTLRFPADIGYFGPGGDVTNDNALFGDYTLIGRQNRSLATQPLIGIQASSTAPETTTPGRYTFYGRYVGWNASDNREPLATTFGAHYTNGATDFIVWRDSKTVQNSFTCNTTPSPFPLGYEAGFLFDDQENVQGLVTFPASPVPGTAFSLAFSAEAQRVEVGGAALPTSFATGWAYLNLNDTVIGNPNPSFDPSAAQAYVSIINKDAQGRMTSGFDAMRYDSACSANHSNPPNVN